MANGQPAAAAYHRSKAGSYEAFGFVVLTTTTTGVARIALFDDPDLFARFGFPIDPTGGHPAVPELRGEYLKTNAATQQALDRRSPIRAAVGAVGDTAASAYPGIGADLRFRVPGVW
jgi:hypothetical protein